MTEIWFVFLAGVAGSAHCIGMCGGIIAAVALARPDVTGTIPFQLLYQVGRISAYTLLGILAGLAGAALDLIAIKKVSFLVLASAHAMVFIVGLSSLLTGSTFPLPVVTGDNGFMAAGISRLLKRRSSLNALPLGFLFGFLPCGLVYAPLMAAGASGRPWMGGATMAALGLGTAPALLGFGWLSGRFSYRLRGVLIRTAGLFIALVGFAGLWRVLGKMGYLPPFPLW